MDIGKSVLAEVCGSWPSIHEDVSFLWAHHPVVESTFNMLAVIGSGVLDHVNHDCGIDPEDPFFRHRARVRAARG